MCLIPTPFNPAWDSKGILTGKGTLACVILLVINGKARTKPLCLWSLGLTHLGIFSALLCFKLHGLCNYCIVNSVYTHRMGDRIFSINTTGEHVAVKGKMHSMIENWEGKLFLKPVFSSESMCNSCFWGLAGMRAYVVW